MCIEQILRKNKQIRHMKKKTYQKCKIKSYRRSIDRLNIVQINKRGWFQKLDDLFQTQIKIIV